MHMRWSEPNWNGLCKRFVCMKHVVTLSKTIWSTMRERSTKQKRRRKKKKKQILEGKVEKSYSFHTFVCASARTQPQTTQVKRLQVYKLKSWIVLCVEQATRKGIWGRKQLDWEQAVHTALSIVFIHARIRLQSSKVAIDQFWTNT
jgi:hypothetical protein